jgi:hypothetical protein
MRTSTSLARLRSSCGTLISMKSEIACKPATGLAAGNAGPAAAG